MQRYDRVQRRRRAHAGTVHRRCQAERRHHRHSAQGLDLTCFSFTNLNYTVTATLTIKDYNFSTRTWVPVCTTGAFNTAAIEGLSTQHLILECFDPVGTPTSSPLHEAELTWNTSLGTAGVAHSSWWVIDY